MTAKAASPRAWVWKEVMDAHLATFGAQWVPLADIGGGAVRVRDVAARWPSSRLVMRLARHYSAMVDGTVHDTWTQHPAKRVYGVWIMPSAAADRSRPADQPRRMTESRAPNSPPSLVNALSRLPVDLLERLLRNAEDVAELESVLETAISREVLRR